MKKEDVLIRKSKRLMLETIKSHGSDPWGLTGHVPEVERWADFLLEKYPQADRKIVMLSVWLHDSGHYPITKKDHAIKGEQIAEKFLKKEQLDKILVGKVMHCIRAHRCKDVRPGSLEAKILACADSASHMTDMSLYSDMINQGRVGLAIEKLERDYRDLGIFPEVKNKLKKVYSSWKKMMRVYEELNF